MRSKLIIIMLVLLVSIGLCAMAYAENKIHNQQLIINNVGMQQDQMVKDFGDTQQGEVSKNINQNHEKEDEVKNEQIKQESCFEDRNVDVNDPGEVISFLIKNLESECEKDGEVKLFLEALKKLEEN